MPLIVKFPPAGLTMFVTLVDQPPDNASALYPPPKTPEADIKPPMRPNRDRKSTRLNSSHQIISYAVFCLKKKTPRSAISSLPLHSLRTLESYSPAALPAV